MIYAAHYSSCDKKYINVSVCVWTTESQNEQSQEQVGQEQNTVQVSSSYLQATEHTLSASRIKNEKL